MDPRDLLFSVALFCVFIAESSSSKVIDLQLLTEQQFLTKTGLSVDINLPRISQTETCTFTTPDHRLFSAESVVTGVTAYGSSDYVSCRIVVGPMDQSLIGKWVLCGSYIEDNVENRRCQEANIAWTNASNPDATWETTVQPTFDHVVYYRGTLSPSARGSGNVVSCHLVTPNNEDLFVTRESEYPNIRLVQDTDSTCSIAIGPIEESHLGSWTIYGTFNSSLLGYNEVRLPMNFDLYDKYHPYEQAYNVTNLSPIQHVVNLGSTIDVEVTGIGTVFVCIFTMPSGMSYNTIDHPKATPSGVSFIDDNRTACRISIGPITQDLIGPWILQGKFTNRDTFTQRIQRFTIIQEDAAKGYDEKEKARERGSLRWPPTPKLYSSPSTSTESSFVARTTGVPQYRTTYPPFSWHGLFSREKTGRPTTIADGCKDCFGTESSSESRTTREPQYWNTYPYYFSRETTGRPTTIADGCKDCFDKNDRVVIEIPGPLAADQDLHFALSLVPMLRQRNLRDKLNAQTDILNYFKTKFTDEKETPVKVRPSQSSWGAYMGSRFRSF